MCAYIYIYIYILMPSGPQVHTAGACVRPGEACAFTDTDVHIAHIPCLIDVCAHTPVKCCV